MSLHWDDYGKIAEVLEERHPETDLIWVTDEEIRSMVIGLPEFEDGETPDDEHRCSAIRNIWVAIRHGADEYEPKDVG